MIKLLIKIDRDDQKTHVNEIKKEYVMRLGLLLIALPLNDLQAI
jgi:hypothetical protein